MRRLGPESVTLETVLLCTYAVLFALLVFFSNHGDWDIFATSAAVDLRAWVTGELPVWSNQYCAGSSRIADPQGIGFNPVFVLVLLFGPILGLKAILILAAAIGFYFTKKIAELYDCKNSSLIALLFVSSSYLLWHFHVGHVSFYNYYLASGIAYYFLKGSSADPSRTDQIMLFAITLSYFLGGFYHSTMFFLLPVLSIVFFSRLRNFRFRVLVPFALAIVAAMPRLYFVFAYQASNPRTIAHPAETLGALNIIAFHTVPVFTDAVADFLTDGLRWGIHEYSNFSLLFVLALFVLFRQKQKAYVYFLLLAGTLLSLGNFSDYSPFTILNKYIFANSVRVPSRFQYVLLFAYLLIVSRFHFQRKTLLSVCFLQILTVTIFFGRFSPPDDIFVSSVAKTRQQEVAYIQLFTGDRGNMLRVIRDGVGIINCYNPLMLRYQNTTRFRGKRHFLITDNEECLAKSYFTQNTIHIDDSCPEKICTYLTDPSHKDFQRVNGRFCRGY